MGLIIVQMFSTHSSLLLSIVKKRMKYNENGKTIGRGGRAMRALSLAAGKPSKKLASGWKDGQAGKVPASPTGPG